MKVLVAMRNILFSHALCTVLRLEANDYQAQTCHRHEAHDYFEPDVILVDHECLQHNGLESWPEAKILLIDTGLQEEEIIHLMRLHKLYGVLSRDSDLQQLKKAIAVINGGQIWINNERMKILIHGMDNPRPATPVDKLTAKESQIVELVVEGMKNREIASRLFLSEQTIKSHLGRIFRKLQVRNRSQLVSMIFKNRPSLDYYEIQRPIPD
ncbi:MAG: response regulator transcription factor [Deltaproteobacteria bacterium]|nr:response regulator transcription factor [Deltaproteobacteria bacterium]TLN00823.1 MAG: response regulator transcription factor [bacterium]